MKKTIFLALVAYLNLSSATMVQLAGLENVNKAKQLNLDWNLNWGSCSAPNWDCPNENMSVTDFPMAKFGDWLLAFNQENVNHILKKSLTGEDSTMTFKFAGYSKACKIILSNKNVISVLINQDGSCYSS
ncbi:Uncharacterised protein [Legionella beliardensis]|uniref:Uncharacterized protein n=1 Tax=Legionella beliardensis TaxID=91822 RepID=A0A378I236_9GAMM|nr:hypothetical protein [Legionella beliardensis]STX29238.1 Uncharacterised protein [Legionella beliardensis]